MNKNYSYVFAAFAALCTLLSVQHASYRDYGKFHIKTDQLSSGGAPFGRTGAPGESNCTVSCHIGTVQDGTALNNLVVKENGTPVTSYVPGTTYSVSLSLAWGNVKEGFEATVLDGTNTMAGSFPGTNAIGTSGGTSSGRDYATHTVSSNLEGNVEWVWDWTAPSTDLGTLTFYVATNIANGNSNITGDTIYLSQHQITIAGDLSLPKIDQDVFNVGYIPETHEIVVTCIANEQDVMSLNIVDLNGRSVYQKVLGESLLGKNETIISLPTGMETGIYVVNYFIGNKPMSKKILIQK